MDPLGQSPNPQPKTDPEAVPRGLSIAEAAARSGVAEKTVRRMIKAGSLPHLKQPIPGGFRYLVPSEAIAQIAHEVGDRVLAFGVPSPSKESMGGQAISGVGGQDVYPGIPSRNQEVEELRRQRDALRDRFQDVSHERDEWKGLAKAAQDTIRALSETIQRLNETNRQLALPEHREVAEDSSAVPTARRGFWAWFLGR